MKENIVCSGALFYATSTKRFLFLQRTDKKTQGMWGLVGGTTVNENLWEGLNREIKEEIGDVDIKKKIPMETFISNDENFLYHTFLCVVEKEFIPKLNYNTRGLYFVPIKASYSKILYLFKEGDLVIKKEIKTTLNFLIMKKNTIQINQQNHYSHLL